MESFGVLHYLQQKRTGCLSCSSERSDTLFKALLVGDDNNASTNAFQEAWCSHRAHPSLAAHPIPPEWRERLSTSSIDFPQTLEYEWRAISSDQTFPPLTPNQGRRQNLPTSVMPFPVSATSRSEMDSLGLQRERIGRPSRCSLSGALGDQEAVLSNAFRRREEPVVPNELVPQVKYTSWNTFEKKPDIIFDVPDQHGITLEAALTSQVPPEWKVECVDCFASATKVTIRIKSPGYLASSCAINVCDDTREHKPDTKAKLARNIARAVRKVLEEHGRKIQSEKGHEKWVIDRNECTGIQFPMVYLTKLCHVSETSWQPELYVAWKSEK